MNSSEFSSGFQATFAMDLNLSSALAVNASEYLVANGTYSGGSAGAFTISNGIGSGTPTNAGFNIQIALNNLNAAGVSGNGNGTAANQTAAAAVTTGYEIAIPLSILGNPTGPIKVLAAINSPSDAGPLSNQWLPGLPVGSSNFALGSAYIGTNNSTACFNFSSTSSKWFTVPLVNSGPAVGITSPTNGANYAPGSNIGVAANATEAEHAIASVAFYANSSLLGNVTSTPYNFTWTDAPAGSYALTAVATDTAGISATSSVVNITVGPLVSITSPANNTTFGPAGSSIVINANASESGGAIANVAFYVNSTLLGIATSSPYSLTWSNVPAGSYALTALATDATGASTTSSVVNVTVSTLDAYDDASAYGSSLANGENLGFGFQPWLLVGGGQYSGFIIQSSGNIDTSGESWDMYANGTGSPYAIAYRGFNNALTTGLVFSVKFQNTAISSGDMGLCLRSDNNTNFIDTSIITNSGTRFAFYIAAGQTDYYIWNGNGLTDSGIASRTTGLSLQLHLLTANTYEMVVKTADGLTTLATFPSAPLAGASGTAIQTFACFNLATASYEDTYFNSLQVSSGGFSGGPVVSITSPTNNADFAPGSGIAITANASESGGSISNVAFYANSTLLGNVTIFPYSLTWSSVPAGDYALTAVAADATGNTTTSTVVNVTVGPVVSITSPASNARFTPDSSITITVNASESGGTIANVAFYANSTLLGIVTNAPYSLTWSSVPAGDYALTAVATDATGNTTTSTVGYVVVSATVAYDDASAYGSSWANGENLGFGFQPWVLTQNNNGGPTYAGFFTGTSGDIDTSGWAWGMYANGTGSPYAIAYRGFNSGLTTTEVFKVQFQNTDIDAGGEMGFCLRSDSNTSFVDTSIITNSGTRFAFYFIGGQNDYYIWNGNGLTDSGIAFTSTGLSLEFYLDPADTYEMVVKTADGLTTLATFPSAPLAGASGAAIQTFAGFNVGSGSSQNAFFNSLQIAPPAPVVSITSPTNNADYAPGSSLAITATASVRGGTIASVAFYANSTLLGIVTSAPYSLVWSNAPAGSYILTAVATDATGNTTTSSAMNVTVGPVVSITSPANNGNFIPGSNIAITANASETGGAIANVEFYANSILLGIATSAPYSFNWSSVPAGDYALTAVATDATGASTTSSVANITVSVVFVPSQIKTVFVIPLENHDWVQGCPTCSPQQIFGNPAAPYVNSLVTPGNSNAVQVSYATKYYSVNITGEHPSEPNYIWSEAGTDFGVHTDNDPSTGSGNLYTCQHLCGQLTAAGI
ncbi:MAG: Ig-like domain-containing protein, partial [Verrucomicrobiia bacterium]